MLNLVITLLMVATQAAPPESQPKDSKDTKDLTAEQARAQQAIKDLKQRLPRPLSFEDREPWKYVPKRNWQYTPKKDWSYKGKNNWQYTPERRLGYLPKQNWSYTPEYKQPNWRKYLPMHDRNNLLGNKGMELLKQRYDLEAKKRAEEADKENIKPDAKVPSPS